MFLLAIASANSGVAMRMVEPMLPQLAADFGTSVSVAASAITGYALAQAGAQFFHGPLGDRYGKLRMATIMLALAAIASVGCALAPGLQSLTAWRFFTGAFASAMMTLGMAYIGDVVPAAERQPVLAQFVAGTIMGQAIGPFFGGVLTDLVGWRASFLVLGAVFAVVATILYVKTCAQWRAHPVDPDPLFTARRYTSILGLAKARLVLVAVFFETFFYFGAFSFLGVLMKERFDLAFTLIGLAIAGFGVGGILYTRAVSWLLRHLGQRGMVLGGGIACGACYIVIALAPVWPLVMACTVGLGFGFYMMHNTMQTRATEMAPQSRGTALALYSCAWALGQAVGVASSSVVVAAIGAAPMIVVFGIGVALFGAWFRSNLHRFP